MDERLHKYTFEGLWNSFSEKLELDFDDMMRRPEFYDTIKQAFMYGMITMFAEVMMSEELLMVTSNDLREAVLNSLHTDAEKFLEEQIRRKQKAQN